MTTSLAPVEVVATFVEGFAHLQRLLGPVADERHRGVRLLRFASGRRGTAFMIEFFPYGVPCEQALQAARAAAGDDPHLISALGEETPGQIEAYRAAGYDYWGGEVLMLRDLADLPSSAAGVRHVASIEEGDRIVAAQREAGLRPHPVDAAHLADPAVVDRWFEIDGEPAAFGRVAVLDERAYLSDIVTLPAFRRRGLGQALVTQLLHDARDAGARHCVLTSSEMGYPLYRALGFGDVMPLTGFQTP